MRAVSLCGYPLLFPYLSPSAAQRLKMQRPMDFDEAGASQPLETPTLTAAQRQKLELGFDSDDMDEMEGDTSSLVGSPEKGFTPSAEVESLKSLLEVERAGLVAAKSDLAESDSKNRALQRKFDQLKSATSGQLAFMKKKLEAQYQSTVDDMEAELEESRDECEALRLQMQQLLEHMEATGAAAPAQLRVATETSGDTRHVEKLKKELVKKDETLRRYEEELAMIRDTQILPAAAECAAAATGVQELQNQLEASRAEVAQLRKSAGGSDSSELQAEVARLTQELRVAKMQRDRETPASTSAPASVQPTSSGSGDMKDLIKIRKEMATMLQKSNEAAERRARGESPTNGDESPPAMILPTSSGSAGHDAALASAQAEAKAAKDSLAAEKAQWEAQQSEWREKEARWAADSEQYKQGMGDEAKAAVEKLEAERVKWESSRTEWHAKEAEYKEQVAQAEAEVARLRAAAERAGAEWAETEKQLRTDLEKYSQESRAALSSGQQVEERLAEVTAARDAAQAQAERAAEDVAALTAQIDQIKEHSESLSSQLAAVKDSAATAAAAQEAAAADVMRLQTQEQQLRAEIQKSQSKVENMKEQMGKAKEHMDAQQQAFAKLRSTFTREMGRVRSELSAVKASNTAVRGAAVVMKEDIAQVTPKVHKKMLKTFQKEMQTVRDSVQALLKEKDARIAADHLEKRKLHNTIQELKGNIRVFCRARPLLGFEIEAGEQSVVQTPMEGEIVILDPKHRQKKKFEFDQVRTVLLRCLSAVGMLGAAPCPTAW